MRIDIFGEDLIVNVDREELTEITCYKTRDHRDVPAGKRNSRTGVRCYALVFDLKQLRTAEGDAASNPESEPEGIRRLIIQKKGQRELLDLLFKAIKAVKNAG